MFGKKGAALVREVSDCDEGQFRPFNIDLFNQVIDETKEHYNFLTESMRKMRDDSQSRDSQESDILGGVVHNASIIRDKRCLMGYLYKRAQDIQQLRWQLGAVLPGDFQDKLYQSEKDFFKGYSDILGSYMTSINLDLMVDVNPPKDPYIQVRALQTIGEMLLDDQATTISRNSIHFIKRNEAEPLISQGVMQEFNE